jgi:transcriptional regulator with XRE-family HTH domain
MVDSAKFAARLQQIIDIKELNASSFAEKIGVGRSSISHILSGRNKPSLDFVLNIIEQFKDVDLYWLLYGNGNYPTTTKTVEQHNNPIENTDKDKNLATIEDVQKVHEEASNLFSTIDQPVESLQSVSKKIGNNITKVIWFYEDGTFKEFDPS